MLQELVVRPAEQLEFTTRQDTRQAASAASAS